eukprot:gene17758-19531_t
MHFGGESTGMQSSDKREKYITKTDPKTAKNIMKLRLNMIKVKANYKGTNRTIECPACGNEEETTEHIFKCNNYQKLVGYKVQEELKTPDATNGFCNSFDELKVRFCPRLQNHQLPGSDELKDITCSSNKPANITIEYPDGGSVTSNNAAIIKNGCNKTIHFKFGPSMCYNGSYKCIVQDVRKTIIKQANVMVYDSKFKLKFEVEGASQRGSGQIILGTKFNLSCNVRGRDWPNDAPYVYFGYLSSDGSKNHIYESFGKIQDKKFYFTPLESSQSGQYTRKLQIARIKQNDTHTYYCRIVSNSASCNFFQILNVTTRPCKRGYYCSVNSSLELPCPAGTYSNKTGVFGVSSCIECPRSTYCSIATINPKSCPDVVKYSPVQKFGTFPLPPAKTAADCQRCPLNASCDNSYNCKFICASPVYKYITAGQDVELRCKLPIQRFYLRALKWRKGDHEYLENNDEYEIAERGDYFRLLIRKANAYHAGTYTCEAQETWTYKNVSDQVKLTVTDSGDITVTIIASVLGVTAAFVVAAVVLFYLIRRRKFEYRRRSLLRGSRKQILNSVTTDEVVDTHSAELNRTVWATPIKEDSDAKDRDCDVFICYSSQDKEWVRKTLKKTLEDNNLKVCIDYKDFAPGAHIIENISGAIDRSRKTIAVLSPDYVTSAWCNEELQMALGRIEDRHQVIPVMYRQCTVPNFLTTRTYLDWCNPDIQPLFWDQLIQAIRDPGNTAAIKKDNSYATKDNFNLIKA